MEDFIENDEEVKKEEVEVKIEEKKPDPKVWADNVTKTNTNLLI